MLPFPKKKTLPKKESPKREVVQMLRTTSFGTLSNGQALCTVQPHQRQRESMHSLTSSTKPGPVHRVLVISQKSVDPGAVFVVVHSPLSGTIGLRANLGIEIRHFFGQSGPIAPHHVSRWPVDSLIKLKSPIALVHLHVCRRGRNRRRFSGGKEREKRRAFRSRFSWVPRGK